jgi:hypothetical protein
MLQINRFLAAFMLVLGVAILIRTVSLGGGQLGLLLGAVFIALGLLRLRATR